MRVCVTDPNVPCNISNAQPIENWHKWGVNQFLNKSLKKSMTTVCTISLPKIIRHDGMPITLSLILHYLAHN